MYITSVTNPHPDPYLGLPDPQPDPLVTSTDPAQDPTIIKQKNCEKNLDFYCFVGFLMNFYQCSGSASGSVRQRYGSDSEDPDRTRNVTDPQTTLKITNNRHPILLTHDVTPQPG
jgi:hypothetical protein